MSNAPSKPRLHPKVRALVRDIVGGALDKTSPRNLADILAKLSGFGSDCQALNIALLTDFDAAGRAVYRDAIRYQIAGLLTRQRRLEIALAVIDLWDDQQAVDTCLAAHGGDADGIRKRAAQIARERAAVLARMALRREGMGVG